MTNEIKAIEAAYLISIQFNISLRAGEQRVSRLFESGKIKGRKIGQTTFLMKSEFDLYMKGKINHCLKSQQTH